MIIPPKLNEFHTYKGVVIAQADGDLGDGLQRTAMFYIGRRLLFKEGTPSFFEDHYNFRDAVKILRNADNYPIRDPNVWNDPKDVSRDQEEPWLIALGLYGMRYRARDIIFRRWLRFGRYQNADIMNPSGLATDLRVLGWLWAWPLIFFGDLWAACGAIIDCVKARSRHMEDGPWLDMDNAVTRLEYARSRFWTPGVALTRWVYSRFFPDNLGGPGILGAIIWKHRAAAGANPAMSELWKQAVKRA